SAEVIRWAQSECGQIGIAWHSLSNIDYLVQSAGSLIDDLLHFIEVAPAGTRDAKQTLGFPMTDLEHALQAAWAVAFDAMFIVTRNSKDYRKSPIPAITPSKFLVQIGRS